MPRKAKEFIETQKRSRTLSLSCLPIGVSRCVISLFSQSKTYPRTVLEQKFVSPSYFYDIKVRKQLFKDLALNKEDRMLKNSWGNLSYAQLICYAIETSIWHRLTLNEICEWISTNVPYFSTRTDPKSSWGWKNSIRHNLSLHDKFVRIPIFMKLKLNNGDYVGRSSAKKYAWTIEYNDDMSVSPYRRYASRRKQKKRQMMEHLALSNRKFEDALINGAQTDVPAYRPINDTKFIYQTENYFKQASKPHTVQSFLANNGPEKKVFSMSGIRFVNLKVAAVNNINANNIQVQNKTFKEDPSCDIILVSSSDDSLVGTQVNKRKAMSTNVQPSSHKQVKYDQNEIHSLLNRIHFKGDSNMIKADLKSVFKAMFENNRHIV